MKPTVYLSAIHGTEREDLMDRLIDKFVERVLTTTESFIVEVGEGDNKKYYFFIQANVGKARYIYCEYSYGEQNFYTKIDLKPELVAIISDGKIFIVDDFKLDVWYDSEEIVLPENTYKFNDVVKKENNYVETVVFPDFYNTLKEEEITDEDILASCKKRARNLLLTNRPKTKEISIEPMFTEQDIVNSLCGFVDLKTESIARLKEKENKWINKKSFLKKVKELMENHTGVEAYELKIAEGIKSVDAKTVTVEFSINGKSASAKINPNKLIMKLIDKDYFSGYDFEVSRSGDALIERLGATTWRSSKDGKEVLTCKHITKITYGKKELYVKES